MTTAQVALNKVARAVESPEEQQRWLAERAAKRRSSLVSNIDRQDALDRLNAAVNLWASYRDDKGGCPSQSPATYFITFKRMAYSALGIDQARKHEDLNHVEQAGLMSVFDALAMVLQGSMTHHVCRSKIKECYREIITEFGAIHGRLIKISRDGYRDVEDVV